MYMLMWYAGWDVVSAKHVGCVVMACSLRDALGLATYVVDGWAKLAIFLARSRPRCLLPDMQARPALDAYVNKVTGLVRCEPI